MIKITELTETKWRTVHFKDAYGNRHREQEEYAGIRTVRSIRTGQRFAHHMIDLIIYYLLTFFISFIFGMFIGLFSFLSPNLARFTQGAAGIFILLLYPIYYFIFEAAFQTTIGKLVTQSVVIDEYGNKPSARIILLRSICRMVPFDNLSCLGDEYSYGWHDKWSGTWVVTKSELAEIKRLQAEQAETLNL